MQIFSNFARSAGFALKCLVLTGAGLLFAPEANAQAIDSVEAVFTVHYNNKETAGENRLHISRDGDEYVIDFELDHWMLSSQQIARFKFDHCMVQPEHYTDKHKRPFKKEQAQKLVFDWEDKKAYLSGDEQQDFDLEDPRGAYDPLSFFFEARCALMAGETAFSYPVISKGRNRVQDYEVIGTELVSTPLGDFEALIVERVRNNPKRQTRLYVAPELDYLLVKIEHQESPMLRIIATLKEMDYQLIDE